MKITGMSPKVGFFLMARQSSKPSIQLIMTSSRITSGRSTCIAEMSLSPLAACPTSKPSSSSARVSISRVSRSSSTMVTFGFLTASPPTLSTLARLGIERTGLRLAVGAPDQRLHPALRLLELPLRLPDDANALAELLDGGLQREVAGLELAHHLLEPLHQNVVGLAARFRRRRRALPGARWAHRRSRQNP